MAKPRSANKGTSLSTYQITDEDKKRIRSCDFYLQSKEIIESTKHYADLNIGEVYSVFYVNKQNEKRYIMSHGSSTKDKYLVVEKDNGFIFAKRLNSSGGTGKDVVCLTIRFPMPKYSLEIDDAQAESIIFSQEDTFDPFMYGKNLKKRKDKARNTNKKILLRFKTAADAYNALKRLKVGDNIWDSLTLYGEGTIKWRVDSISVSETDKTPQYGWNNQISSYGRTYEDQDHNKNNLPEVLKITITTTDTIPKDRTYSPRTRNLTFKDLQNSYRNYFIARPVSVDDEQT